MKNANATRSGLQLGPQKKTWQRLNTSQKMQDYEKNDKWKKIHIYIYIWLNTYRCTYTYHKIALDRPQLKEESVSASLKEASTRFQIFELKLTDYQWPQRLVALDLRMSFLDRV